MRSWTSQHNGGLNEMAKTVPLDMMLPEGWKVVRVGYPKKGEYIVGAGSDVHKMRDSKNSPEVVVVRDTENYHHCPKCDHVSERPS
jgi:hypothetical protein